MIEFLMIYQNVVLVYLAIFGTGKKKPQSLISCSVLVSFENYVFVNKNTQKI